jgi:hypothetical protein
VISENRCIWEAAVKSKGIMNLKGEWIESSRDEKCMPNLKGWGWYQDR